MFGQSSETLAGRISYKFLAPFLFEEISANNTLEELYLGGFPRSILAKDEKTSYEWRQGFITIFLERDFC
jgi:predicted AAA+ superfamily ATPase